MNQFSPLAWLYWDPPQQAFTIPFLDLPVMWYGIIFALGFVLGYFILIPILMQLFGNSRVAYARDITNWSLFATQFKALETSGDPKKLAISANLTSKARQNLNLLKEGSEPSAELKQSLLDALNSSLKDSSTGLSRNSITDLFPQTVASVRNLSVLFTDRITWFIVIGTIVGARLGHVFFYDWPYYEAHPLDIIMIRKGGLASHGGTVGVILSLLLFLRWNRKQFPEASLVMLFDVLVIPTAVAVCCIRIGNFFNQEILGYETTLPWAVLFGHPSDGPSLVPRHPVQLYEAAAYLATFIILYALWKKWGTALKPGVLSGIFFILVFGSRFFIEFLKTEQTSWLEDSTLQMGQYLSIPFVCLGMALLLTPRRYYKLFT